ncbi:methyltransferase domain-containing protein [Massilia niastensis]|uniref:methyltransferase domain-containing protein n=1 Tax=Massilia niastensis TaxID=544911 RepID=UPI00036110D1|nr:methyltransferase domain-containing protein [Massilia niastensis]
MAADPHGFSSRDPLSPQFWDERFARGFTPWDQGGVPAALRRFVAAQARPLTVLIPGCGSGYELAWLMEQGWDATAIDFAPGAVAQAKQGAGKWSERVLEADFFAWQPAQALDMVYERAFLCAMPPAMWPRVAARWAELLAPGALLAGFFFFDSTPKGPPFGIDRTRLDALLGGQFDCIEDAAVDGSIPIFVGKERWMVWRRR